jgi:hypothetical protein
VRRYKIVDGTLKIGNITVEKVTGEISLEEIT